MKFSKECPAKYVKVDVQFDDKEHKLLRDYGLKHIILDDEALINYAINKILLDTVKYNQKNKKVK